jgi:putative salt-induced outer membrane protein YdiY
MRTFLVCLLTCLVLALFVAPLRAQDVFQEGTTVTLELQNGDKLTGILEEADEAKLILIHPVLGRLEIARSQLKAPAAPEPVVPVEPWTGTMDASFSGSSGNSDTGNARIGLDMKHDYAEAIDDYTFWFRRASTDNDPTEEKYFAQVRHEWKIAESRWRPFVQGSYEHDIFAGFDARAAVAAGGAYQIVQSTEHNTVGRIGAGVSHKYNINETPSDDIDGTTYEALFGLDWTWTMTATNTFTWSTDVYPSLSDTGEWRYLTRLAFDSKVTPESPWFVRLGYDETYDSQPGEGAHGHDRNYYAGIGRNF